MGESGGIAAAAAAAAAAYTQWWRQKSEQTNVVQAIKIDDTVPFIAVSSSSSSSSNRTSSNSMVNRLTSGVRTMHLAHMFLHIILSTKGLIANGASKRFLILMNNPNMFLKMGGPAKRLGTTTTLERAFLSMNEAHMILEGTFPRELGATFDATMFRATFVDDAQMVL